MIAKISALAPTSTPRVGSSSSSRSGLPRQPLGEHDLLLVAAAERPRRAARSAADAAGARAASCSDSAPLPPPIEDPRRRERVEVGQRDVGPAREVEHEPGLLAVLGHQCHAGRDGRVDPAGQAGRDRRPSPRRPAARHRRSPSSVSVRPEPSSPAMATTSPLANVEREVVDERAGPRPPTGGHGQVPDLEPDLARLVRSVRGYSSPRSRPTIIRTTSAGVASRASSVVDRLAVAQDGDAVGDARTPRRACG